MATARGVIGGGGAPPNARSVGSHNHAQVYNYAQATASLWDHIILRKDVIEWRRKGVILIVQKSWRPSYMNPEPNVGVKAEVVKVCQC